MSLMSGGRVVVVGASIAGLLAARVLARAGFRVTLYERDALGSAPGGRPGTPQTRHAHALLGRGCVILDRLFPDLVEELEPLGVHRVDWGRDLATFDRHGWLPRMVSGVTSLACSRDLLEHSVRRAVTAMPNVRLVTKRRITGLVFGESGSVLGLRTSEGVDLAEVVVDASGRRGGLHRWLGAAGVPLPPETRVVSRRAYATRWYRGLTSGDWSALLVSASAPERTRGVIAYPTERDWSYVTLVGAAGDVPPTDPEGFLAFARSLPTSALADALERAEPAARPIWGFRDTATRYRHVEHAPWWPDGLLLVGDALCALNPVYAQGMTVAAVTAEALEQALLFGGGDGLAVRYHALAAAALRDALMLATAEDLRWPGAEGAPPEPVERWQLRLDALARAMIHSDASRRLHLRIWHLLEPLSSLESLGVAPEAGLRPSP